MKLLYKGVQCAAEGCFLQAHSKGMCPRHYAQTRRAGDDRPQKLCKCGAATKYGQTLCGRCHTRSYREEDLAVRKQVQHQFALQKSKGEWPSEFNQWIELQMCHGAEMRAYLQSRAGKRKVWPDTDHSLSCWMQSERDPKHACDCGAARLAYEVSRG